MAGQLVAGFPPLIPLPPGATVATSALEPAGPGLVAVSLTATTALRPRPLLTFYLDRLGRAGFTGTPDGPGRVVLTRGGGEELLTVAVVDRGAERSFSVGGTVADS